MIINFDKIPCIRRDASGKFGIEYSVGYDHDRYSSASQYCKDYDVFGIELTHTSNIKEFSIETLVPKDILLKVHNKEILLGIFTALECTCTFVDLIYEFLVIDKKVPPEQILLVAASIDYRDRVIVISQKYNLEPIKLEYYAACLTMIKMCYKEYYNLASDIFPNRESSLKKDKFDKKYLCINRVWHPHRAALICLLNERGLIDDGHISYMDDIDWEHKLKLTKKTYNAISSNIDKGSSLKYSLPIKLDREKSVTMDLMMGYSPKLIKYYNESYFSIVTETLFDSPDPRYLSEKTFKAILYKHPFIIVAPFRTLEMLKLLGFKTFSGMIDESYDQEPDDVRRLMKIVSEIERLCNLSNEELSEFKRQCLEIVEYNFNHFVSTTSLVYKIL